MFGKIIDFLFNSGEVAKKRQEELDDLDGIELTELSDNARIVTGACDADGRKLPGVAKASGFGIGSDTGMNVGKQPPHLSDRLVSRLK